MKNKPISFITIKDVNSGRVSSLGIHGRDDKNALCVIGNLEHNCQFAPTSINGADKLIKWLEEWKAAQ